jgi:hypothetical protein
MSSYTYDENLHITEKRCLHIAIATHSCQYLSRMIKHLIFQITPAEDEHSRSLTKELL